MGRGQCKKKRNHNLRPRERSEFGLGERPTSSSSHGLDKPLPEQLKQLHVTSSEPCSRHHFTAKALSETLAAKPKPHHSAAKPAKNSRRIRKSSKARSLAGTKTVVVGHVAMRTPLEETGSQEPSLKNLKQTRASCQSRGKIG